MMRTFHLTLGLDMKAVVPEQFTQDIRAQATAEDASPFLKNAHEMFPEDDEQFTLHILKHGVRRNTRMALAELFESSGLGCTLSPVTAKVRDVSPPPDSAVPVLPTELPE